MNQKDVGFEAPAKASKVAMSSVKATSARNEATWSGLVSFKGGIDPHKQRLLCRAVFDPCRRYTYSQK